MSAIRIRPLTSTTLSSSKRAAEFSPTLYTQIHILYVHTYAVQISLLNQSMQTIINISSYSRRYNYMAYSSITSKTSSVSLNFFASTCASGFTTVLN